MKSILSVAIIIVTTQFCKGQLIIEDYLLQAENDPRLTSYQAQSDYLSSKPYRLSYLNKVELRTRNNEFNLEEQEYALRVKPTSPWEVRSNNRVFSTQKEIIGLKKESKLKDILYERYVEVLQFLYLQGLSRLQTQKLELIHQGIQLVSDYTPSDDVNADYLIGLKLDYIDMTSKRSETQSQLYELVSNIQSQSTTEEEPQWNYAQIIGYQKLLPIASESQSEQTIQLRLQEQQIKLAEDEYAFQKSRRDIGFIQTEYSPGRKRDNQIEVALGISLPISNKNKANMTEKKLDVIQRENKLEETKKIIEKEKKIMLYSLKRKVEKYHVMDSTQRAWHQGDFLSALQAKDYYNSKNQIKLKLSLMKLEGERLKAQHDMFLGYINYLYSNDKIQQQPISNYLSPEL